MTNLAAAGIDPKSIDMVVISHFHGDHVNGLLDASNKLAFPNAEILVPEAEWKFWMDDGEMSRASAGPHGRPVQEQPPHLRRARPQGHALRLGQGDRAGDHCRSATTGHSIGHTSYVVSSGKSKVYRAVGRDQQSGPVRAPSGLGRRVLDQDRTTAVATRGARSTTCWSPTSILVQGFHYPFPGLALVEKAGNGYRVIPAPWNPTL